MRNHSRLCGRRNLLANKNDIYLLRVYVCVCAQSLQSAHTGFWARFITFHAIQCKYMRLTLPDFRKGDDGINLFCHVHTK